VSLARAAFHAFDAGLVEYVGFLFDTRSQPTLRIPVAKRKRAFAVARYLLTTHPKRELSRLGLSVVAGTLESLSDATPSRIGHTYLRRYHSVVHPTQETLSRTPSEGFSREQPDYGMSREGNTP